MLKNTTGSMQMGLSLALVCAAAVAGTAACGAGGDNVAVGLTGGASADGGGDGGNLVAGDGGGSGDGDTGGGSGDGGTGGGTGDGATRGGTGDGSAGGGTSDGGGGTVDGGGGTNDSGGGSDGGSGVDAGSGKPLGCSAAADCVALCKGGGADCLSKCLNGLDGKAQGELLYLVTCVQVECQQGKCKNGEPGCVDACIGEQCMAPLLTCLDDGTVGTHNCWKGYECVQLCKNLAAPWSCYGACYNGLSNKGQAAFDALAICWSDAQKAGQKPDDKCVVETATCYAGDVAGNLPCHEVFGCVEQCQKSGKSDDLCGLECLGKLTDSGKKQFATIGACWESAEVPGCKEAFLGCTAPVGSKDCGAILSCQGTCQGKDEAKAAGCVFSCLHQGSSAGASAYLDVLACDKKGTCGAALYACAQPAGKLTCTQAFGCIDTCSKAPGSDAISCVISCLQKSTPAGGKALVDIMVCDGNCKKKCGSDSGPCKEACVSKDCGTLVATCGLN